jgi:hypothetical protein
MPTYRITATRNGVLVWSGTANGEAERLIAFDFILRSHPGCLTKAEPVAMSDDLPIPPTPTTASEPTEPTQRRRRVVRVELPDELHALATLTGRDPEELVKDLLSAQVAAIRARAKSLMAEAV